MKSDRKKRFAALFILVMFLGSSIAIGFIDALSAGDSDRKLKLPEKVSYSQLSLDLRNAMLSNGYMIAEYRYPETCINCNETIQKLSNFISDKPDAYLVVLSGENENVELSTNRDYKNADPKNENELIDTYCSLTYYRYEQCILRKI